MLVVFSAQIDRCLSMEFLKSSAIFEIAPEETDSSEQLFGNLTTLEKQTASNSDE